MKPQLDTPSRELSAALDRDAPMDRVARVLADGLAATTTTRSGTVEPCWRTRMQAASLIIAQRIGMPIQRTESVQINLDADSSVGLKERLRHSPALRKSLAGMLAEAAEGDVDST
jgi:hypothetical protein